MKSYKDCNKQLHIDATVREHTIQAMMKRKKRSIPIHYMGIAVTCCVIIFLFGYHPDTADHPVVGTVQSAKSIYNFDEYILQGDSIPKDEAAESKLSDQNIETSVYDVAGSRGELSEIEQKEFSKKIPTLDQLVLPKQFISSIQYLQYKGVDEEGFPIAQYKLESSVSNEIKIQIEITDEKMPVCLPNEFILFPESFKQYQEYQLRINLYDTQDSLMIADAKKDHLIYHIYATGLDKMEFYTFLESFLL